MAKYSPLPKSLQEVDRTFLSSLIEATEINFKGDLFGEVNAPQNTSYTTPDGKYHWNTTAELYEYVTNLTQTKNIRAANASLYENLTRAPKNIETQTKSPKYTEINTTALRSDQIENITNIAESRDVAIEETKVDAKRQTQEFLDREEKRAERLREIIQKLEQKEIYIKVNSPEATNFKDEQINKIKILEEQAKADSKSFVDDLSKEIEKRILPTKPNDISVDDVKLRSKMAALDAANSLINNKQPFIQIAVVKSIASKPESTFLVKNLEVDKTLKEAAQILTNQKLEQYKLNREFISASFGANMANRIFGPEDVSNVDISFSATELEGFKPFNVSEISNEYTDYSNKQNFFFENLNDFSSEGIKSHLLSKANLWVNSQISKLPANSLIVKTYNTKLVQASLSYFGLGAPVEWAATNTFGRIAISTGFGPSLGWAGQMTGIDFGVTASGGIAGAAVGINAAASAAAATTTSVAITGGTMAAEAFAGGVGGAMAGSVVPGPGTIVGGLVGLVGGLVGGEAVSKIAKKIPWHKVKKNLPYIAGATALVVAGPAAGIFVGLGMAAALGISGGLAGIKASLSSFGASIGNAAWMISSTALSGMAAPIIGIVVVFPIIVIFILFIINSGAHVVPPAPPSVSTGSSIISPYIDVTKTPNPTGPFENSNLPLTVEYSIKISAKEGNLTNIKIEYDCVVTKEGGSVQCPPISPEIPAAPENISPSSPFTFSYSQTYSSANFQDSLVIDTITVTADAVEQAGAKAAGSASIKIGNPPDTCPSSTIWPLSGSHTITQTPGGSFSHKTVEAIDLSAGMGTPVKATHSGIATVVRTSNAYRPLYIDIASNCGGKSFTSRYAHLSSSSVQDGQEVTMGHTIGTSGTAGTGPHLHYEFRGLRMDIPYVPKPIIRNCSDDGGKCGSIP